MKHKLFCDTETYSEDELKKVGGARYVEGAEIIMLQYALDDAPPVAATTGWPELMTHTDRSRVAEFKEMLVDPDVQVLIHNAPFDVGMLRHAWGIELPPERIYDTMIQAMAHGLPGGLGQLSTILKMPPELAKQSALGHKGMMMFAKPRPANQKIRRATPETHPGEWADFLLYGLSDITAMREAHRQLPTWNYHPDRPDSRGRRLWTVDREINSRGIGVDLDLVDNMLIELEREKIEQKEKTAELTEGQVASMQQRDELLVHLLMDYGVALPDMKADTLRRRLQDEDLPPVAKELIELRLRSNKTSTAKYRRLRDSVSSDGRLRQTLQLFGAQRTGRFAGRVFQPHNLPRPDLLSDEIESGIELVRNGEDPRWLLPDVTQLASNAIRGVVVAPPGKKLVISDWSNIEGRVSAWLTGEAWKIEAFKEFDAGTGPDLYVRAYAKSFGVDPASVGYSQRQIGKVQELSMQYQGGGMAFASMAAVYRMDLQELAVAVRETVESERWTEAEGFVDWMSKKGKPQPGNRFVSTACEVVKAGWRAGHPAHVAFWAELEQAWTQAVRHPGEVFRAGPLAFRADPGWLRIRLPSGRYLVYAQPRADENGLRFMGLSPYSRQWKWIRTWGGRTHENLVQAIAGDVLLDALLRVNPVMPVVLHVHDELITEVPDRPEFSEHRLSDMMCEELDWAPGLPLAAKGFVSYRYRKDD